MSEQEKHYYREVLKSIVGLIRMMQEVKAKLEPLAK